MMRLVMGLILCLLTSLVQAKDSTLATGELQAIEHRTGNIIIKGQKRSFPVAPGFTLETYHKLSNSVHLLPGMKVSLFSEDGRSVSRILIHGPYSLIKQAETH